MIIAYSWQSDRSLIGGFKTYENGQFMILVKYRFFEVHNHLNNEGKQVEMKYEHVAILIKNTEILEVRKRKDDSLIRLEKRTLHVHSS